MIDSERSRPPYDPEFDQRWTGDRLDRLAGRVEAVLDTCDYIVFTGKTPPGDRWPGRPPPG
jgi:hypothetical protein